MTMAASRAAPPPAASCFRVMVVSGSRPASASSAGQRIQTIVLNSRLNLKGRVFGGGGHEGILGTVASRARRDGVGGLLDRIGRRHVDAHDPGDQPGGE